MFRLELILFVDLNCPCMIPSCYTINCLNCTPTCLVSMLVLYKELFFLVTVDEASGRTDIIYSSPE